MNNKLLLLALFILYGARTLAVPFSWQEPRKGKVMNLLNQPIAGATVQTDGAQQVFTDEKGEFSIPVKVGQTLHITSIGYESKEVRVHDMSFLLIQLADSQVDLEEVVVVGFGRQSRANLTGSVSTITMDDEMSNRPITNISQALVGTASGVWASQNVGQPGKDNAQINIRGWGTLNNTNPLVIINGVEGSLSNVNPADVESISVLKDASSAAIYGSKAANGVVLVTLKGGQYNQPAKINFNSYVGNQSLGRRYELINNSAEYMTLWNQALANRGGSPLFPQELINDFATATDPFRYPNTDFFQEVYRNAAINDNNLSVSGGSDKSRYYMSLNYLDQDGILLRTDSRRYSLAATASTKIRDYIQIGVDVMGMRQKSTEPFVMAPVFAHLKDGGYPYTAAYTRDGRIGTNQAIYNDKMVGDDRNPLYEVYNGLGTIERNFTKLNAYADVRLSENIEIKSNVTSQYSHDVTDRYNTHISGYTDDGLEYKSLYQTPLEANRHNNDEYYFNWFTTLNFKKSLDSGHDFSGLLGFQYDNTQIKTTYARRTGPPKEGLSQVDAGTSGFVANGNQFNLRNISYFGRINYNYQNKYLFEFNTRADASSRFKEGHRWGFFPAVSMGWRLSEETPIRNLNFVDNLKLKASWGKLGNQNVNSYWPYLATITLSNETSTNFGDQFAPGAALTSLVDETITWETGISTDVGLEFGTLNNKLNFDVTYFHKITEDIIVQLPIPETLGGVIAPFENVGEMLNRGWEIGISYSNHEKERNKLRYSFGANFTRVKNEVTKFREDAPDQLYLIREGYSYRTLYGLNAIGIYQTDQEAVEHMHANGYTPKAGELKYQDVNGDGRIGYQDMMGLGNTIPGITYGFNTHFQYHGFDVSIFLQGLADVYSDFKNSYTRPFGVSGGSIAPMWRNAWTPENSNTEVPRLTMSDTWRDQNSNFWIKKMSYLKVKNIQLGYAFNDQLVQKMKLNGLYVYVNMQNYWSIVSAGYQGFDPERSTFNTGDVHYPTPRIFSFGVNVGL